MLQEGKDKLIKILRESLKQDTRAELDKNVHIVDLSKNTMINANRIKPEELDDFSKSYVTFIKVLKRRTSSIDKLDNTYKNPNLSDITLAVSAVSDKKIKGDKKIKVASIWLDKEELLVTSGYDATSRVRTDVYGDPELVNDVFFGKSNRVRSIYEQLADRNIIIDAGTTPSEEQLTQLFQQSKSARDALYLFPEMVAPGVMSSNRNPTFNGYKVYKLTSKRVGQKSIAMLEKVRNSKAYSFVVVTSPDKSVTYEPAKDYVGYKISEDLDEQDYNGSPAIVLDTRLLSVADVGHAYFMGVATGQTPSGNKLNIPQEIVDAFSLDSQQSSRVNKAFLKLQQDLNKVHGAINFDFYKKTLQKEVEKAVKVAGINNPNIKGAIVVVFQNYKINNDLSTKESSILAEFNALITQEILDIPGSNTLKQDLIDIYSNKVFVPLLELGGKAIKKLVPTSNLAVKQDIKLKTSVTQTKRRYPTISRSRAKVNIPQAVIRNTQGRFTSLANLQTLLNLALSQQIQQNMGTGTSKNVLNYRSGRFAESAQVTSMSQSREGMITAFYTYQRNPYGTFSEGGAQSSPRTRDPKLLISKSIREVLATQVNNRMRAVLA